MLEVGSSTELVTVDRLGARRSRWSPRVMSMTGCDLNCQHKRRCHVGSDSIELLALFYAHLPEVPVTALLSLFLREGREADGAVIKGPLGSGVTFGPC